MVLTNDICVTILMSLFFVTHPLEYVGIIKGAEITHIQFKNEKMGYKSKA